MEKDAPPKAEKEATRKCRMIRCKVNWANAHPGNENLPISVNLLCPRAEGGGKRDFMPGQEVTLSEPQLKILEKPIETTIEIDERSGIYHSTDPVRMAQEMYPGFSISRNSETGMITAKKSQPQYFIERIGVV